MHTTVRRVHALPHVQRMAGGFRRTRIAGIALAVLFGVLPAVGADSARVGAYDFSYLMSGDTRARPVQVFDDGRSTYFQFRAGEPVPAIFAARDGAPALVVPTLEGPYVRVPELHGRFVLQVGRSQAHVVHGDGSRPDAPPVSVVAADGMTAPYSPRATLPAGARLVASLSPSLQDTAQAQAVDRNSYATPARGDRVYWATRSDRAEHAVCFQRGGYTLSRDALKAIAAAASGRSGARYIVIGRDDDTYKEGLEAARASAMRDALVKAGIPQENIALRTGVMKTSATGKEWESTIVVETAPEAPVMQAAPPPQPIRVAQASAPRPEVPAGGFTLAQADKTIQGAVRRWAQTLDYQLVWEAPAELDAPLGGTVTLPGRNLTEALDVLVRGLKEKGYDLEVTLYANRVIRIARPGAAGTDPASGRTRVMAGPSAPPPQQWQMLPTDRTVAGTLARWATGAKWTVDWKAKDQVPVTGAATLTQPDFKSAADYVMQQVTAAGYRLRVSTQGDSTLVVSSY